MSKNPIKPVWLVLIIVFRHDRTLQKKIGHNRTKKMQKFLEVVLASRSDVVSEYDTITSSKRYRNLNKEVLNMSKQDQRSS